MKAKGKSDRCSLHCLSGDYSAEAVAELYRERWEIELGFRDIKSSMQQNAVTLRSKKINLIYQEVWGLLLAYNIIRREASQAAVAFGRTPSDIRFKPACQYIAVQLNRHGSGQSGFGNG